MTKEQPKKIYTAPDAVAVPVLLFDWHQDRKAQKHANEGGIAILQTNQGTRLKGVKKGLSAIVYGPDREALEVVCEWLGLPQDRIKGKAETGGNRYHVVVNGKYLKRAYRILDASGQR